MLRGNMGPTGIGSLPHGDVNSAVDDILAYTPEIPFCPQLPRVDPGEGMYEQVLSGIPGLRRADGRTWVDTGPEGILELERLEPGPEQVRVHPLAAAPVLLARKMDGARAIKGQIAGPVSLGLSLTDSGRRPLLYSPEFMLGAAQVLAWKVAWLENCLARGERPTLVFLDEPYLNTLGSGHFSYSTGLVGELLELVLSGIEGFRGIHCCGNTDWPVLLHAPINVLSFDAADHFRGLSLYPGDIAVFLERGGNLAWGIVPTDRERLARARADDLAGQLDEQIRHLATRGVRIDTLRRQSLITPACGLASLDIDAAERALDMVSEVSAVMRVRHDLPEIEIVT